MSTQKFHHARVGLPRVVTDADIRDLRKQLRVKEQEVAALLKMTVRQRDALASVVTEFLNDQETMNAPYRNEAICEKAREVLMLKMEIKAQA